jgi:vancomycin resistance protein YoaR
VVTADRERVQATIDRITAPIVKPAIDARFAVDGDLVRIIPSKTGLAADSKAAYDLIARQIFSPTGPRTVSLGLHSVQPKLTTAGAKGLGIRQRISSYTTEYSSGNPQRVNNIHLLAKSLNNTLIAPGDEFSFNKIIGPRTAAKGYQEAPVIMNGKLVPALGGGICQVGTTIFNTVFFSGLPVTQRTNHSFYISHYPDGRDATVSWDGPDFRFKNETSAWLLIKTFWGSEYITISLYGTSPGYTVTYKTGSWRNQVAFPVSTIGDPTMYEGVLVVEDVGVAGHDVTVTRTVTKKGKVVRQDEFASYYRPKEQVVRKGTKKKPAPPPPSKPATGTPDATSTGR